MESRQFEKTKVSSVFWWWHSTRDRMVQPESHQNDEILKESNTPLYALLMYHVTWGSLCLCRSGWSVFKCPEYSPLTKVICAPTHPVDHIYSDWSWFTCKKRYTMQKAVYDLLILTVLISIAFRCKGAAQWSCSADFHLALRIGIAYAISWFYCDAPYLTKLMPVISFIPRNMKPY